MDVIRKMGDGSGSSSQANLSLTNQPFAKPESVRELVGQAYKTLKSKVPAVHQSMSLYLANRETEAILFKPIKVGSRRVVVECLSFYIE